MLKDRESAAYLSQDWKPHGFDKVSRIFLIPVGIPRNALIDSALPPRDVVIRLMTKHLGNWMIGAAVAVFSVVGLSRLDFDVDVLALFPPDLPETEGMRVFFQHFSRENEVLISLQGDDPDAVRETAEHLATAIQGSPGVADQVVWRALLEESPPSSGEASAMGSGHGSPSEALDTGAELIAWSWWNGDTDALRRLTERLEGDHLTTTLKEASEELGSAFLNEDVVRLGYDPLRVSVSPGGLALEDSGATGDAFVSPDGTFRVLYVGLAGGEAADYRETADRILQLETLVQSTVGEDISTGFTGEPVFVAEISTGMERDIRGSSIGTTLLIGLLFWIMHRTFRPLVWLVSMLLLIFAITLSAGALFLGRLSVLTVGFAAILIGLVVDYGVVIYREAGHDAQLRDPLRLRRAVAPGILWAALTTAVVFFSLNVFSLPSVRDLGNLVGIGILVGAVVMVSIYLPFCAKFFSRPDEGSTIPDSAPVQEHPGRRNLWRGISLLLILTCLGGLYGGGMPLLEKDFRPLSQRRSQATRAFEEIQDRLFPGGRQSVPLVATGATPEEVRRNAGKARETLEEARQRGEISRFTLEPGLVPEEALQAANAPLIGKLVARREAIRKAILDAGFTDEASALFLSVCDAWARFATATERPVLPSSDLGRWLIGRAYSDKEGSPALLGSALPSEQEGVASGDWTTALRRRQFAGFQVTGWTVLTAALIERTGSDLLRDLAPLSVLLVLMLLVTFRSLSDTLLSLGCLLLSGLALMAVTRLVGWTWNYFNLAALPILLGTGIDYSIHMILALRRHQGDLTAVHQSIGRALWFCGLSTALGFGSLTFASSNGLSSLGLVCGTGILLNMLIAVYLLPHWRSQRT